LKHRSKEEIAALVLEASQYSYTNSNNDNVQSISNARTAKGIFGVFNGKGFDRIP
jgi:hypothetical protein